MLNLEDTVSLNLTQIHDNKTLGRIHETEKGMAHWSGTGPNGKTCRECVFFTNKGHYAKSSFRKAFMLKPGPCLKFQQLMRDKAGPSISPRNRACRYFEQHSDAPPLRLEQR